MIEISQLIHPFFSGLPLLKFLQNRNSFFYAYIQRFIKTILQNIAPRVSRRDLYELFVIFACLIIFSHLNAKLTQRIDDQSACRVFLIGHQKNVLTLLKPSVDLIQIAYGAQHHNASDSAPVNFIRDLYCFRILSFCYQCFDLVHTGLVLKFIQGTHLINVLYSFIRLHNDPIICFSLP